MVGPAIVARLMEFRQNDGTGTVATAQRLHSTDAAEAQFMEVFRNSQCFAELADHAAEVLLRLEAEVAAGVQTSPKRNVAVSDTSDPDPLANSMRRRASFNNAAAQAAASAAAKQHQEASRRGIKMDERCPHSSPFLHELLQHHPGLPERDGLSLPWKTLFSASSGK